MKIYTKRGDGGETDLFGGDRVLKDDRRVEAYGAVDELNAFLGMASAASEQTDVRELLTDVQRMLFHIGSTLATSPAALGKDPTDEGASEEHVSALEAAIDRYEKELEPLRAFILPGGTAVAAHLHAARTVCRRAERRMVSVHRQEPLPGKNLRYVNRLSDLLFVLARLENARADVPDVEWTMRGS